MTPPQHVHTRLPISDAGELRAELVYAHCDGALLDREIHEHILADATADAAFSACIIRLAVEEDGLSVEEAFELFRLDG